MFRFRFIIGFILLLALAVPARADVLTDCRDRRPDFTPLTAEEALGLTDLDFRLRFERKRQEYHDYMNCVFETSANEMVESAGPSPANLMKPGLACLDTQKLTEKVKTSSPEKLLGPLQSVYQNYVLYLEHLFSTLQQNPAVSPGGTDNLAQVTERQGFFRMLIDNEASDALVALDSGFSALKEMRQAFVMHVHFQCWIRNLESFRNILGELREIVLELPPRFLNCSKHKG